MKLKNDDFNEFEQLTYLLYGVVLLCFVAFGVIVALQALVGQ